MSAELHLVRVAGRSNLADGVVGLTLEPVDGALPRWTPGAHIDLVLPSGIVRQYSLCGPLTSDSYEIAVLREPKSRGGSEEVHKSLRPGMELKIHGPRNRFALERADDYLFIAGGIGITPLLPMIEAVDGLGLSWRLVYGGRSRATMAFLDILELYENVVVLPQDEYGLIDVAGELADRPGAAVYACGPTPLIDAVQAAVAFSGAGPLHVERFVSVPVELDAGAPPASAFEVQLGADGPVVAVADDQSILDALLGAGVDVLFSCEEGTCGSCQTRVLAGEVDHRDGLLTEQERADGDMLICVSRCTSGRLVLDVTA
ncbi:PDR/VanB family oxidoreductase [Nocardioides aquiterrae]|uniref:PDR/VanB family oxidoreductase n=1 Tax=Nocardioides aquiterrae TaxID=203799 RepID=A0ABP4F0R7_9ACTN